MPKNREVEAGLQYEFLGCHVTILNLSRQLLKNGQWSAPWGKYTATPSTNLEAGSSTTLVLLGRSASPSGSEGAIVYEMGTLGGGSIAFSYSCPLSGENYGRTKNDSADLVLLAVYGRTGALLGMGDWGPDPSQWGTEGDVPAAGHPLSLLFVVRDFC